MGAIVGTAVGFIVGLVGGFVLGSIGTVVSDAETALNIQVLSLLLTMPVGLIVGIMVPIREASRRRRAAKAEEEDR
jgi:Na+/proline symporter